MKKYAKAAPSREGNRAINDALQYSMEHPESILGHVEVTRVIREHMPLIKANEHGSETIGNQIDNMLIEAVKNGDELQGFAIEFDREKWGELATGIFPRNEAEAIDY